MEVTESLNSLNRHTKEDDLAVQASKDASIGDVPHALSFSDQYRFHADSDVAQVTIQSHAGSPASEPIGGESGFTYVRTSAASAANASGASVHPAELTHSHTEGKFYLMTSPDLLQHSAPQTIAPPTQSYTLKMEAVRTPRDERRRAQHNEVERRRRDKINTWIETLSKIIPDCSLDANKTNASKGGILSKACDHIQELRQSNHRLQQNLQELTGLQTDNETLRRQVNELKNENALLRAELLQRASVLEATSH